VAAEPGFVRESVVGQGVVGIGRPSPYGETTNLGDAEGDAPIVAVEVGEVGGEAGARLQMQAALAGGTVGGLIAGGAEVPRAE
jgi:hypothetical protein